MKRARKLPGPPPRVVMKIKPFEVFAAWLELHQLEVVRTLLNNARWDGGVLIVKKSTGSEQPW